MKHFYREKIKRLLREPDAVMVAHYYTDPEIQQLAEETGGCISDSLEMARFGARHSRLNAAGCRRALYGRNGKILSPEKNHPDAYVACGVFARSGPSDRGV